MSASGNHTWSSPTGRAVCSRCGCQRRELYQTGPDGRRRPSPSFRMPGAGAWSAPRPPCPGAPAQVGLPGVR